MNGASVRLVLGEELPAYCLRFDVEISEQKAVGYLRRDCPILSVAVFYLTKAQWVQFSSFFQSNPSGVLSAGDLDGELYSAGKAWTGAQVSGHAVALLAVESFGVLVLANSWGPEFANKGFFRIQSAAVLNLTFYPVYWTLEDLTEEEIRSYSLLGRPC